MDVIIRRGEISDVAAVLDLYDDLNDCLATGSNHPGWKKGIYPTWQHASDGIREQSLYVAIFGGRIVGSIIFNHHADKVYELAKWNVEDDYDKIIVIHTLVVHPEYLKSGIGRQLVSFACRLAGELDMKAIRLDVYKNNLQAIKLYENFGFRYTDAVKLNLGDSELYSFLLYEKIL